ncbi:MAG TPA: glycosyl hydrolase [Acidobacteriaceae bacterium]|nr:glycosyl hydrolase [Acidobacteriaceae bacterium]
MAQDSAALPAGSDSTGAGRDSVRQLFQSTPKKYRPLVRWWWPGDLVAEEELRREVEVLDKAGFGGAEIQAFFKSLDAKAFSAEQMQRINGFATPSFFRHVGIAADEARKRGMFIDYTFGSGWPFGGGEAVTPELASVELNSTHLSIRGPARLSQKLHIPSVIDGDPSHGANVLNGLPDGWAERMKKRTRLVAVVAVRGEDAEWAYHQPGDRGHKVVKPGQLEAGTSIDLTANMKPDGTLEWDVPSGTWQVFVFCSVPTMQKVNAGAGEGPQLVMDHLSVEAFRAHAKRVGDNAIPYLGEYFGNGLRAVFCDSLEVWASLFWTDDFLQEFSRRRGYNLAPYLPILKVQTTDEPFGEYVDLPIFDISKVGDQIRHDYRQTVSDLMAERFYGEFNKWAHDHKLLSRTQAHGSPTDVLRVYGESDIPETEDLYDEGGYDFLKMAASAAHVYGRSIVGSESFVWPTAPYQTTPEKVKLAADELLTAGVNAIVYHGFPYIVPEVPPPGWHPFSGHYGEGNYSTALNEMNPFWPFLGRLNDYMARVQFLSQIGTNVAAVALYRNDLVHGAVELPPAPRLNQALMDAGYNYDHINADSLSRCSVRDHMLLTAGGAQYRVLVLPGLAAIDARLAEKLESFANAGLPIIFAGEAPNRANGLLDNKRDTQRVLAAMRGLHVRSNAHFVADAASFVQTLSAVAHPDVKFHSRSLPFTWKRIVKIDVFFLRNSSDASEHVHTEFKVEGAPQLWDPWTGEIGTGKVSGCKTATLTSCQRKGSWMEVEFDLQPLASALIIFDPDTPLSAVKKHGDRNLRRSVPVGDGGWKLTATGHLASSNTATINRDLPKLIDWSLDNELRGFSGRAVYTTTFSMDHMDAGSRLILDLGSVRDVAEVTVNGKEAGTLLLRPYEVDITELVKIGENRLEIAVTNALFNYMVMREPRTFRAGPTENPSGLMSAGLIGPTQLKIMS